MTDWAWSDGATGFISIGDARLEAMAWGPPPADAPTIVMLHEGLGSAALWRDFPKRLAEATGWGVLAYSRAGYGRSSSADLPRPIDYMTREALDVLPGVLDVIGFQRGVLLGHFDGATIAAGGPAPRDELLASKRHAAVAAGTSRNLDEGFVDEDQASVLSIRSEGGWSGTAPKG